MKAILLLVLVAARLSAGEMQTLRGGGIEVSVDLTGWTQQLGPAVLHDDYVRLGQFGAPGGRNLSILLDHLPPNVADLNTLCLGSQQSYGGAKAGVKVLESLTFSAKNACLFTLPTEMVRRNLYVEMIVEERWLEIHYSAPDGRDAIAAGRQSLEAMVASLTAKRDAAPPELLMADIGDPEVALVQKLQGCGPKSKDCVCRALAAFHDGKRPAGRSAPVGIAGITMPIVFGLNIEGLEPRPTYVVLSDTRAALGSFGPAKDKQEEKAASQLVRAVKSCQPPDADNALVKIAQSQIAVKPAGQAERSLVVSKGFLRETSLGLVFLSLVPNNAGVLLGVFPVVP
jgi:hypothetical protein